MNVVLHTLTFPIIHDIRAPLDELVVLCRDISDIILYCRLHVH